MNNLREKLKNFLGENIKNKNQIAVSTCRLMLAAIKDRDIESRTKNKNNEISDTDIFNLLQGMVKQRKESMDIYKKAGREELKIREENEIDIIKVFLPKQLTDEELRNIVDKECNEVQAETIKDLGKLMNVLREKYPGQLDLKKAANLGKTILSK